MYKKVLMRFFVLALLLGCLGIMSFGPGMVQAKDKDCIHDCKLAYDFCVAHCPDDVCVHNCKLAYDHCVACCNDRCD